ncbi:MAG TPA: hypothetical protein DDZ51_24220 [Planctomycetaceae bacterium]|nr:hypothetical protein [Planctomycetaceae bacterium]
MLQNHGSLRASHCKMRLARAAGDKINANQRSGGCNSYSIKAGWCVIWVAGECRKLPLHVRFTLKPIPETAD